jgi:hypothetical protein
MAGLLERFNRELNHSFLNARLSSLQLFAELARRRPRIELPRDESAHLFINQ